MSRIATKAGTDLRGLHPKMEDARIGIAWVFGSIDLDLTWTSGIDGKHKIGSLHYVGRAIDIRTRHVSDAMKNRLAQMLRDELGWGYDVVVHATHIHVEWDPKQ